jgi:hypothetical protein
MSESRAAGTTGEAPQADGSAGRRQLIPDPRPALATQQGTVRQAIARDSGPVLSSPGDCARAVACPRFGRRNGPFQARRGQR